MNLLRRLFCGVFGHTEPEGVEIVREKLRQLPANTEVKLAEVSCAMCGRMIDIET